MMEQQLKERLVGATVLVLLAIILIPAILDGPDGSGDKVEKRLDLPVAGSGGERRTVRIPLDEPAVDATEETTGTSASADVEASPLPASDDATVDAGAGSEPADEPVEQTAGTPSAHDNGAAAAASTSASGDTTTGALPEKPVDATQPWTVQVGSFSNEANAAGLVERLRSLGYDDAFVSRYDDGSRIHYRVRVGGYADREEAAGRAAEIRERSGQPARPAQQD